MHTQTNKTHHDSNSGEATTFPFIVFFVISYKVCIQMSFCSRTPNLGLPKFPKLELLQILKVHNFLCRPLIEVRFEAKL
jgi:hypothetical protein